MIVDSAKLKIKLGESYLILGNDTYTADSLVSRIKHKLVTEHKAELITLYGNEIKANALLDVLDSFSLFSSSKLVIIKNADDLSARELEVIIKYFESEHDDQSLVMVAEKLDAKLTGWRKIKERLQQLNVEKPKFVNQLKDWTVERLKAAGKQFTPKALDEFISRVELDYAHADNELQKIFLLTDGKKNINETDVIRSLGTSRSGTIIDLHRALGKRNLPSSISQIQTMLANDWEPTQIFFNLRKVYLTIWKIRLLKDRHITDSEIINSHLPELFPSQKKEYVGMVAHYSLNALKEIFAILLESDARTKSSNVDTDLILYLTVTKIMNCR